MRSQQCSRAPRARMSRWFGGILSGLLLAGLGFTLLMVAFLVALQKSAAFREQVRRFNKRTLNPAVLAVAGRVGSPYAVMHHTGRRSGRSYTTPIRVRPTPDGFIVPLPYGREVDWCRNVIAADGAVIAWQGKDYPVDEPKVTSVAAAATLVPLSQWRAWFWSSVFPHSPLGTMSCLCVRRRTPVPEQAHAKIGSLSESKQ
jgi:deazaflavin-dependent oxidoreductase (nitroreductase family)